MEEKKNNGKGLLVVLVLIIIALAGYIAYKGFVSKPVEINTPESVESVESKAEETSVVGVYESKQDFKKGEEVMDLFIDFSLFDNNMYCFHIYAFSKPTTPQGGQYGSNTYIGSYKIKDDKIHLYQLFDIGNDGYGSYESKEMVVEINDDNSLKIPKELIFGYEADDGKYSLEIPKTGDESKAKTNEKNLNDELEGMIKRFERE